MAKRSIGLSIEILNRKNLTEVENAVNKLNKTGIKLDFQGLDKLANIQDLINNLDKLKREISTLNSANILNSNKVETDNKTLGEMNNKMQQIKNTQSGMSKYTITSVDDKEVKKLEQYNQIIGRTNTIVRNLETDSSVQTSTLNSDKITNTILNIQKAINSAETSINGFKMKNQEVFNSLKSDELVKYGDSISNLKNIIDRLNNSQPVKYFELTNELNTLKNSVANIRQEFSKGLSDNKALTKEQQEVEKLNNKLQTMIGTISSIKSSGIFNNGGSKPVFNRMSGRGLLDRATKLTIDTDNLEKGKKAVQDIENSLKSLQTNSSRILSFEPILNKFKELRKTLGSENLANMLGLSNTTELNNQVKKYTNLLNSLKNNSGNISKSKFDSTKQELQDLTKKITELSKKRNQLQNLFEGINKSKVDTSTLTELQNKINSINVNTPSTEITKLQDKLTRMSGNATTISTLNEKLKSLQKTYETLQNTNSKGLGTQESIQAMQQYQYSIRALQNILQNLSNGEAKSGEVRARVTTLTNQCKNSLKEMQKQIVATDNSNKGFLQRLSRMGSAMGIYMSTAMMFRRIFNSIKQGIQDVVSLEDSMISLQRVYNITGQSVQDFQDKLVATSRQLATSATDYTDTVTSFKKLGYDINEAQNLATETTKFNLAGDIDNMEQATSSVISVLKGFKLEASDVTQVVDAMNTASNEYAVSASDLADIMQKSSASLSVYGNSLNESLALGTVANEIMQDSSRVGRALKTLSARIGQVKDGVPKFREELLTLTGNKVDILDTNNELKSTYKIMKELGSVWNNLNSLQKSQIGNDLFGKDNITTGYAILENYEKLDEVVNSLNNSMGSVDSEFNKYVNSTSGKVEQLKDAMVQMWSSFVDSDMTKGAITAVTKLVDTFGNLKGVILLVTTAIMVFKGNAIQGLVVSLKGFVTDLWGCVSGESALTASTFMLSSAFEKLKLAFMSNPLGILAVALTTVIALMGQAKTSAEKFEESIQSFSEANDNYNSAKESSDLLNQQEQLEIKLASTIEGTQDYKEATEELHDVQVKLAEKFPQLIDGFDKEGNALVRNSQKVRQSVKQETELATKEMESAIANTRDILKSDNSTYSDSWFKKGTYMKGVSGEDLMKYGNNFSGDTSTPASISYENTYKLYRKMLLEGKTLNKDQSTLYDEAQEKLSTYNDEVSKLYAQTQDLNSIKKFDIFDFEKGDFVNAKTYFQELQNEQKKEQESSASTTAKIQAYAEAGYSAKQISDKLGISLESVTSAMSALGDETDNTTSSMEELSGSYSDNLDKANLLKDVIEEYQENGGLSLETKDKIFSSGYEDIIQALGNNDTFLSTMEGLLNDCMIEAEGLENKMLGVANSTEGVGDATEVMSANANRNFNTVLKLLDTLDKANAEEVNSLAKKYNIDLKNKEMSENEKLRLATAILNNTDSATATLINSLGEKYGVDVSNFTKAQQEKERVLEESLGVLNYKGNSMTIGIEAGLQGKSPSEMLKQQMNKINQKYSTVMGVGTSLSGKINSNYSPNKVGTTQIGTTGVSSSGGGSGSNGGSGTERDYSVENLDLKDYIENHYKLEDKIRDVQHQQDLLSKSIENTYGKNKVKLQNQYINKLKEEQNLQKQLLNEQKQELQGLQNQLKGFNAHFDSAGNLTNMTEMYYHWITIANAINDSTEAGANQKKQAQERVNDIKDLVSQYRDLQEQIQDTESTFYDLSDTMKDVYQQMSDVCIEAEETIANAISEYIENIYDENTEVLDKLRDKIDKTFEEEEHEDTVADYQKQLLEIRGSIEDAMKTGNSSLVKQLQQEYEDVQKEYSDYMKNYEKDKALEKLDEEQEKLDKQKEELLSSENLTKLITQAMSEGFINVNGTIVQLDTLMNDFTKNNTVGMQNLVNETNEWNETLMTAINTASQLSGINSSLGLNTTFTYTKAMQDSINQALKEVKSNSSTKNLNVTSPLVVIENVTSDNYNDIIDQVTSQIYNTLDKVIE